MPNESQNSSMGWRNKLELLDQLPDQTFEKAVAWDKLHEKVGGKTRNKKFIWLWLAAASVACVVAITLFFQFKTKGRVADRDTVVQPAKQKQPSVEVPNQPVSSKDVAVNLSEVKKNGTTQTKTSTPIANNPRSRRRPVSIVASSMVVAGNSASFKLPNEIDVSTIVGLKATVGLSKSPLKKLEVVHINELGNPAQMDPDFVHNFHLHKLKLANEEVYVNSPPAAGTSMVPGITTKL